MNTWDYLKGYSGRLTTNWLIIVYTRKPVLGPALLTACIVPGWPVFGARLKWTLSLILTLFFGMDQNKISVFLFCLINSVSFNSLRFSNVFFSILKWWDSYFNCFSFYIRFKYAPFLQSFFVNFSAIAVFNAAWKGRVR